MKKQKNLFRGEEGQTILEILLAFGVSVLVLSAIILGIITSLNNAQYAKNQGLANSYAQEGMAVIRQIKDSSWTTLSSYTSNTAYCLGQNPMELVILALPNKNCKEQSPVPVGGIFSREVKFDQGSSDCCPDNTQTCAVIDRGSRVTVRVSWADNKCPIGTPLCHNVTLITCFSNTDQKQVP